MFTQTQVPIKIRLIELKKYICWMSEFFYIFTTNPTYDIMGCVNSYFLYNHPFCPMSYFVLWWPHINLVHCSNTKAGPKKWSRPNKHCISIIFIWLSCFSYFLEGLQPMMTIDYWSFNETIVSNEAIRQW